MNLVHPKNDSAGNPLELYPFQRDLLIKQLSNDSPYIYDACDMGCLSGDTEIKVNRGGCSRNYTIREMYTRFHSTWSKDTQTKVRSFDGARR